MHVVLLVLGAWCVCVCVLQAVVGSIVREKELRLREGMRILGLSVRYSSLVWIAGTRNGTVAGLGTKTAASFS